MLGPEVRVERVIVRSFEADVHQETRNIAPQDFFQRSSKATGCLLGVSDGAAAGWWGPISPFVAHYASQIFASVQNRSSATLSVWTERMRRAVRHAHTGVGAVAIGAFELALWDMAGHRARVPVWKLL